MKNYIVISIASVVFITAGFWIKSMVTEEKQNQENIAEHKAMEPELKNIREEMKVSLNARNQCLKELSEYEVFDTKYELHEIRCSFKDAVLQLTSARLDIAKARYYLKKSCSEISWLMDCKS